MEQGVVEFAQVSYTLPAAAAVGARRPLLQDIDLRLEAGTTTALLGRSGSGKTTLLRMVNGLVQATSGTVSVLGTPVCDVDLVQTRRNVGYVIQETGLFPHMTVERNVGIAPELAGWNNKDRLMRTREVLALVGIDWRDFGQRYPRQLSGGQRQRVGFARALALDPSVMLLDEPFGALDPLTRAEMQTMLKELLLRVQKTVLLVTHDLDEALFLAQRVIFLEAGRIVADHSSDEVLHSGNAHVKDYISAVHRTVLT